MGDISTSASNDSKFTGNSQTKPLSKMQLLKPPHTESIANTYSKKINTIIINIQPNSSPRSNTHKVVNDQTFRLDNLIISPTPIPSSQPSGQVSSTCTHCLLPRIEAFGIHGRLLQGIGSPSVSIKKLHGMKSGASDLLTDRMAQKSRSSRSTKNSGVSFNETFLSFCRFKGGDPYQQNEPIPPQVLQETLPSNRIKDIERTQATFTSPSST